MLDHPDQSHCMNLQQVFNLTFMQKINFTIHLFHKILQRNSKLVILGNLDMPGYTHLKRKYQFEKRIEVYLQGKNQLHTPCCSGDTAKICKLILGTLGMPGYTHPK